MEEQREASGKSFALLLEPVRHLQGKHANAKFGAVIFRRQTTQVRNEGGLWDESHDLYPLVGGTPKEMNLEWVFPSGSRVKFAHLEHEASVLNWQGSQINFIGFDELTHFTETQFFYMMSRNRSTSGIKPYIRATCNADANSWVKGLIQWWINPDTGLPIKERSGVLRWFIRDGNELVWADSKEELIEQRGAKYRPKSLTFISALLQDNKILMDKDPDYLSNLMALDRVQREQLLHGNWNVTASAGNYFRREYFRVIDSINNASITHEIRYWDRAGSKPNESNKDPDWTVGIKIAKLNTGGFVVMDVVRLRGAPLEVEKAVINTAHSDGYACYIGLEQDPGSAGLADVDNMVRKLEGFIIHIKKPSKDKETRARPISAQAEHGNIYVMRSNWNGSFFQETENFPEGSHDDQVDALSGGFNALAQTGSILDVL